MSHVAARPEQSTTAEASLLTALNNLTAGGVGTAIQKTTSTTFSNVSLTAGSGTVTMVSITTANGVSGTVTNATTTPAISLTLGAITPSSVNGNTITTGTGTLTLGSKTLVISNTLTLAGTDSTTMTFPSTSASVARIDAAQTFVGVQTLSSLLITTPQAITVTTNAGTADVTHGNQVFTNSSAATMTITLATSGAVDGQLKIVRTYDSSAAAQSITWVNTENSSATPSATSNGSTTLPRTDGFQFNGATSKWRCVASA